MTAGLKLSAEASKYGHSKLFFWKMANKINIAIKKINIFVETQMSKKKTRKKKQ